MSATDHLGTYAEGSTKGDADMILSAASERFVFDDPNAGRIPRNELAKYLSTMKATARSLLGGELPEPFHATLRSRYGRGLRCAHRLVLVGGAGHANRRKRFDQGS